MMGMTDEELCAGFPKDKAERYGSRGKGEATALQSC